MFCKLEKRVQSTLIGVLNGLRGQGGRLSLSKAQREDLEPLQLESWEVIVKMKLVEETFCQRKPENQA